MDLSIIVPVYNTPIQVLQRCFSSLQLAQEFEYEVLIVDDGSREEVGAFCREYSQMHSAFTYLHQENRGVSAARNLGLQNASGDYIAFVDADDELLGANLQKAHLKENWDIVFFDYDICENGHQVRGGFPEKDSGVIEKEAVVVQACQNRCNTVWGKLFRRQLIEGAQIAFDEKMVVAEDAKFVFEAIMAAERFLNEKCPVYRYYHSAENGGQRGIRFARQVLENVQELYSFRMKKIDETSGVLCYNDLDSLKASHAGLLIGDLFNTVGTHLLAKAECKELTPQICELTAHLMRRYKKQFRTMTRLKGFLLSHNYKGLIWLYAYLRKLYLRIY